MTDDVFQNVKDLVSLSEAVRFYGYDPNRAGYIRCPFHNEKTASLKLYEHNYHCFGCDAHGTVIDFVAGLFNLSPLDAVKRLNSDFNLGLCLDGHPDPDGQQKRLKTQEARRRFEAWRDKLLNELDAAIRTANLADYQNMTEAEVMALRYREALEAWADVLMHGNMDEQMQIFRDREEVGRICQMILKPTQTKSTAA